MNINTMPEVNNLFKLLDLLKDTSIDGFGLLVRLRKIIGEDTLENYEKLLANNALETKRNIIERIKAEIIVRITRLSFEGIFNKDTINKYVTENIKDITVSELTKTMDILNDDIQVELLTSEFTEEMKSKIETSLRTIRGVEVIGMLETDLKAVVSDYNALLNTVDMFIGKLQESDLIYIPVASCIDIETRTTFADEVYEYDTKVSLNKFNTYKSKLSNLEDITIPESIAVNLDEAVGKVLYDYTNDIINKEDYSNKVEYIKNLLSHYLITFFNYKNIVTSYIEMLEAYQHALENINYVVSVVDSKVIEVKPEQ